MDAMALLCTLHADGPTTLKRLRQAGCDSIEAVGALDPDRLAKLLVTTPAAARRFLREAAHLASRLDTGFLEREEKSIEAASIETAATDALSAGATGSAARARETSTTTLSSAGAEVANTPAPREKHPALGYRDQRIVEQVLQAWRKHDAEDASSSVAPHASAPVAPHTSATVAPSASNAPGSRAPRASDERGHQDSGSTDDGSAEAARAIHPDEGRGAAAWNPISPALDGVHDPVISGALQSALPGASSTDLFPGAVDGLDQETCLRLRQAGIHDVDMLARLDPLALSKTLGIGYMRLTRLCALARRRVSRASESNASESTVRESNSAHPSSSEARSMRAGSTSAMSSASSAGRDSEIKFSRAGNPTIGVLPALAEDLEIQVGPKPLLPSRTRWSPSSATSAASDDGEQSGGPFA